MAQNYVVMARKNLLKPSEAPKYYAVARSGRKVTVKEVCKRITERSSYSNAGTVNRQKGASPALTKQELPFPEVV